MTTTRSSSQMTLNWRFHHVILAIVVGFVMGLTYDSMFHFKSRTIAREGYSGVFKWGSSSSSSSDEKSIDKSNGIVDDEINSGDKSSTRSESGGDGEAVASFDGTQVYSHDFPDSSITSGPIISKFSCVNTYGTSCTILGSSSPGRNLKATSSLSSTAAKGDSSPIIECREATGGDPSCVLENVCIRSGAILYFLPKSMPTKFLPPEWLAVGYYGPKLKVEVRDSSEAEHHTFIDRVVGLVGRYYPLNIGHAIADELIACFMLFLKFGIHWNSNPPPLLATTTEPELLGPYELLTDVKKNVVQLASLAGKCYTKVAVGVIDTGWVCLVFVRGCCCCCC